MNIKKITKLAFAFYVAMHLKFLRRIKERETLLKYQSTQVLWLPDWSIPLFTKCCAQWDQDLDLEIKKILFWRDYNLLNNHCQCSIGGGKIRIHRSVYYVPKIMQQPLRPAQTENLSIHWTSFSTALFTSLQKTKNGPNYPSTGSISLYWSWLIDISISRLLEGQLAV